MNITVNGQSQSLSQICNISDYLNDNGYGDKLVAVAINGSFVPKSLHAQTQLNDGDTVEIVAPMQGG